MWNIFYQCTMPYLQKLWKHLKKCVFHLYLTLYGSRRFLYSMWFVFRELKFWCCRVGSLFIAHDFSYLWYPWFFREIAFRLRFIWKIILFSVYKIFVSDIVHLSVRRTSTMFKTSDIATFQQLHCLSANQKSLRWSNFVYT